MAETKIEWADFTFNPWSGCTKVAEGCKFCYAEVNYSVKMRNVKWGPNGNRVLASDSMWTQPIKWNKQAAAAGVRKRVFCASLADVFEDWSDKLIVDSKGATVLKGDGSLQRATLDDVRRRLFALIDATPNLDWLLLTKRPENIRRMTPAVNGQTQQQADDRNERGELYRRNLWLGTSIATQADADKNIPELLKCRDLSPVLWVSAEPLIEAVDLFIDGLCCDECRFCADQPADPETNVVECRRCDDTGKGDDAAIDWVVIGGESGPHARPCDVAWIRSLRDQCQAAGVSCFIKQLGGKPTFDDYNSSREWPDGVWFDSPEDNEPDGLNLVRLADPKGGSIEEWPSDLKVRDFPND